MRIAITGANGMIGKRLTENLNHSKNKFTLLVRKNFTADPAHRISIWNPEEGEIYAPDLEHQDAVINLAGKNVAAVQWTEKHKRAVLESRLKSTELLCKTLASLKHPPEVLLSASAIGYYGNRDPQEVVDEWCGPGTGFMSEVCQKWEEATKAASDAGIRVITMRTGLVLTPSGGALAKMLPIFRIGLGGKLGSGSQVMSWIDFEEIDSVVMHLINTKTLSGPVNVVSPNPVTNKDFAKLLARSLSRPAIFSVPSFGAKLALGEMAEEMLLSGARIVPRKLLDSGYEFRFPDLASSFEKMLKAS